MKIRHLPCEQRMSKCVDILLIGEAVLAHPNKKKTTEKKIYLLIHLCVNNNSLDDLLPRLKK